MGDYARPGRTSRWWIKRRVGLLLIHVRKGDLHGPEQDDRDSFRDIPGLLCFCIRGNQIDAGMEVVPTGLRIAPAWASESDRSPRASWYGGIRTIAAAGRDGSVPHLVSGRGPRRLERDGTIPETCGLNTTFEARNKTQAESPCAECCVPTGYRNTS